MTTILLEENPMRGYNPMRFEDFGEYNPRRRARKKKNILTNPAVAMPAALKGWTQGVGIMDAAGALGGIAMASWLPGVVVKAATTTGGKVLRIVLGLVSAGLAGYIGNAIGGKRLGQAAVIGGLAGTAAGALGSFTSVKWPGIGQRALSGGRGSIGEAVTVSPSFTREGETVVSLQP